MARLEYNAEDFGPSWGNLLRGRNELVCSWEELVWASITVGKRNWSHVWKHGFYSAIEVIFRTSMVYAYLIENSDQNLEKSEVYKNSDPSEKSAISYFQGIMITKLLANKLFKIPWLMHLDVYKGTIPHSVINNSRPDLIGVDSNRRWFIFEAKGRSNGFSRDTQNEAKKQTRQLRRIDGQFPMLRAAVQSYYSSSNLLKIRISDPDEVDEDAIDLDINFSDFLDSYYEVIIDVLNQNIEAQTIVTINQNQFVVVNFEEIDLSIGLQKKLYDYLNYKKRSSVEDKNRENFFEENRYSEISSDEGYIGIDGIFVKCGLMWNQDSMKKQPNVRMLKLENDYRDQ